MRLARSPLLVGTLAAGGLLAVGYFLSGAGRSPGTLVADGVAVVTSRIQLSPTQLEMVRVITRVFQEQGYGWLVPAAVANAYAESRLDPDASGDGGHSIGLFQLHDQGAGAGMSVAERRDPTLNARRALETAREQLVDIHAKRGDRYLTRWFAAFVENCAACGGPYAQRYRGGDDSDVARRIRILERLYPEGAIT